MRCHPAKGLCDALHSSRDAGQLPVLPALLHTARNALHETERGTGGGTGGAMCCHLCPSKVEELVP